MIIKNIDIQLLKLLYNYKINQKHQIILKRKWQFIQTLNRKVKNMQKIIIPVYNLHKNSLDDVLNKNINAIMTSKIDINSYTLK